MSAEESNAAEAAQGRGYRFWLVFFALCVSAAVIAIEISAIGTALPTIIHDLGGGSSFIWVGSAFTLSSTAFVPLAGDLAEAFGRRPVLLGSLVVTSVGSAVCGSASSMNTLIAGRVIQGVGGGGVDALIHIILADLVPLSERGNFNGYLSIAWAFFTGAGPIIAGALAQHQQWRWLFYLNIPLCALSGGIMTLLQIRNPPGTLRDKLGRIDVVGNTLVLAATSSTIIALTWGGVSYLWSSWRVLVPLLLGLVGLAVFFIYEAKFALHPVVPFGLLSNRTSFSGYCQTFINSLMLVALAYYVPVYYQACKGLSPTRSGVDVLVISFVVSFFAILGGITSGITGRYRPQMWVGWVALVLGTGLLVTVDASSSLALLITFVGIACIGIGLLTTTVTFPILAPLPVERNAPALALYAFFNRFAQVWGVTIPGAVLQNALQTRIPQDVLGTVGTTGAGLEYALIPLISALAEPQRGELRAAFGESLRIVWKVLAGICGLGLLSSLPMRGLALSADVDEKWGMDGPQVAQNVEMDEKNLGLQSPSLSLHE